MKTLGVSPMTLGLIGIALLPACNVGRLRMGDFATDTLLPPVAKLVSNAVIPFAGKETIVWLDEARAANRLGYFEGEPRIVPLSPNLFWFYQPTNPSEQFSFTTYVHNPDGSSKPWKIVPQSMIFDGASVPRVAWHVKSYGPFDFTKSALIHDWLYEAHHRARIAQHGYNQQRLRDLASKKQLNALKDEFRNLEMYVENEDPGGGHRDGLVPRVRGLTIDAATKIMVEAMYREMLSAQVLMDLAQTTLQAEREDQSGSVPKSVGDPVRGLTHQVEPSLSIARPRRHILGMYRWSLDSRFSRAVWEPKRKDGLHELICPHSSSAVVLEAMRQTANQGVKGDPDRFRRALADRVITPELTLLLFGEEEPLPGVPQPAVSRDMAKGLQQLEDSREVLRIVEELTEQVILQEARSVPDVQPQ